MGELKWTDMWVHSQTIPKNPKQSATCCSSKTVNLGQHRSQSCLLGSEKRVRYPKLWLRERRGGQSEFTDRKPFVRNIKTEGNKTQMRWQNSRNTHINDGVISWAGDDFAKRNKCFCYMDMYHDGEWKKWVFVSHTTLPSLSQAPFNKTLSHSF